MGMKGCILSNSAFLLGNEGVFTLIFANSTSLTGAIVGMIFFSLFVQAAEGSTFGIVPYIDPEATGSVSGMVGAVLFGICFRQLDYKSVFYIVGGCVLASAFVGLAIIIKGQFSFICGRVPDTEVDLYAKEPTSLAVPEVDEDANDKE
jgi:NNP family nitrate/nitrite transporter-like MFS transporter